MNTPSEAHRTSRRIAALLMTAGVTMLGSDLAAQVFGTQTGNLNAQEYGDAVYRYLLWSSNPLNYNHAGIYAGQSNGNRRCIETNLGSSPQDRDFQTSFTNYLPNDYYGAFTVGSGLTFSERRGIVATALSLIGASPTIGYTFANALVPYTSVRPITPSNIYTLRCDGLVEYCYEGDGNGIRSWHNATVSSSRWNIASWPNEHNNMPGTTIDPDFEMSPWAQRGAPGYSPSYGNALLNDPAVIALPTYPSPTFNRINNNRIDVTLRANDESGIAYIGYILPGTSSWSYSNWQTQHPTSSTFAMTPLSITTPGNLDYFAEDNGGNYPQFSERIRFYSVTATAGSGGSMNPAGSWLAESGGSVFYTASPNPGYVVNQWLLDGNLAQTGGSTYTLSNIQASHSVQATFTPSQYTITASAGTGGSISPSGQITTSPGTSQSFMATPNANHVVNQWLRDSVVVQTGGANYTLSNIQANHTIQVTFTAQHTITASAGSGGSISPSGAVSVSAGSSQVFTATPITNYVVNQWFLDGALAQTGGTSYTLSNIQANHTVHVTFTLPQYTITASAGAGGSISPNGAFVTSAGSSQVFSATPNANYVVNQWLLNGSLAQTGGASYTLPNIQSNHTIQVTFTPPYTITASAGAGGSISPSGAILKPAGSSQLFTATPTTNYIVSQWLLNGSVVQTGGNSYTLTNIQANQSIQVTFTLPQYTITASAGAGGSISPSGSIAVSAGSSQLFTATPNTNYVVDQWWLNGSLAQTGGTSYTLSNIQANHSVQVTFRLPQYAVTASAGAGGSVSPNGPIVTPAGSTRVFTATPNTYYVVDQWLLNGSLAQTGGASYTLPNIQANHSVQVTFVLADCATQWLAGGGVAGVNGPVYATLLWDPDGPGPLGAMWIAGGSFGYAGTEQASNIAAYDPVLGNWSALGAGLNGAVRALAALPNGDLVVGGEFTTAGGGVANRIALWNGTNWSALGTGMNYEVLALTTLPNGDVVAGGKFWWAGGVAADYVARWNGSSWAALGGGLDLWVFALTTLPNGDLVAGGYFSTAGGVPANRIARWNGTSWSALGAGVTAGSGYSSVYALATLPNGDLVAGGNFLTAGGVSASRIARWDGMIWSALGSGMGDTVHALTTLPSGGLVAGGSFTTAGGGSTNYIARWNGANWSALGSGLNGPVFSLTTLPSWDLVAGGSFTTAGGGSTNYIARWNGANWSALGPGLNGPVFSLTTLPTGDLVAGGSFTTAGGGSTNYIARWNGANWSALGSGLNGPVFSLTTLPNGDLVAGGGFTTAGGVPANRIARWNGTSWSALGTGLSADVRAVTALPNGDLVVGGSFTTAGGVSASRIARWDGINWSALAGGGWSYPVEALVTLPSGDIVAGGWNHMANYIARWNGTSWSALGTGLNGPVSSLTTLPNGDLVAGGGFTTAGGVPANRIARWNGMSWSAIGSGMDNAVRAMRTLPNGDLVAAGDFTTAGGVPANRIARWNGTSWSALATGMNSQVNTLMTLPSGDLVAGGSFTTAGGLVSAYLARLTSTCPAVASIWANGCPSSGGSNTLSVLSPAWADATFRALGTGLPTTAIVMAVTSVTSIPQGVAPLAVLLPPLGQPGCDLLVVPDILEGVVTTTGSATSSLFLPNAPPIIGVTFYHQMIPIEIDGLGNWTAITSTNALQLTAGSF